MGRSHWHPSRCHECGRGEDEAGRISQTGLCAVCGKRKLNDAHEELRSHSGAAFERWRRGMAACVGAVFPPAPDEQLVAAGDAEA